MAELTQNPINFPWALVLEAQRMKNANQQQMYGDIAGIGQGLGNIGQQIGQYKAQDIVAQALEAMKTGKLPMQGPQLPGVGMTQGQPAPTSGMGAPTPPPQMPPNLIRSLMTLDPKFASNQFDELRQSEIIKNLRTGGREGDIMYGGPEAEAALEGNIKRFSELTGGKPIPHKTLSIMSQGQYRKGINDRFGKNMDWRNSVEWQNIAEGFNKDVGVKNARESLAGADKVLRLNDMQSALGDEAMGFLVPRALEEVGNLAQAERTAVRISPNLANRAKSMFQRNIGPGTTLTERDRADLKEIMLAFRRVQERKLDKMQEYYASQASENFGVPFNLAKKRLGDISKLTARIDGVEPPSPLGANPVGVKSGGWSYVGAK